MKLKCSRNGVCVSYSKIRNDVFTITNDLHIQEEIYWSIWWSKMKVVHRWLPLSHGWMDGIRITDGMERYTSGIPIDNQSKEFKEVGSGEERDYNNFNTGVKG